MNEVTGFNPEQAKKQICDFYVSCAVIATNLLQKGVQPFVETLQVTWCSPRAEEFSKQHFPRLYALGDDILTAANTICRNATTAYNNLAASNNEPKLDGFDDLPNFASEGSIPLHQIGDYVDPGVYLDPESPVGIVGMNKAQVKNARGIFAGVLQSCVDELQELPLEIAFYDPNGEMRAAYEGLIRRLVDSILEEWQSVGTEIDSALEEEEDRIELAKNEATQAMNG